jgi:GTP-binding protein EngB required for normal cell division
MNLARPAAAPPTDTPSNANGFHENHRAQLRLTFQHIDKLLSESSRILVGADDGSPFNKYAPDAMPLQRKVASDYVTRLRAAMVRTMQAQAIPFAPPVCGALWAARTSLTFAEVTVEELTPKRLRGYGQLSDEASAELDRIRVELHDLLNRFSSYLAHGAGGDLQARLARLENTGDEIKLLRELERIVTAHGLVEVRDSLSALLDRLEGGDTFEIGVFGRVSAGKSSLLNHLLGGNFLPVGVTPVTALPIRLRYGARPGAVIAFAEKREGHRINLDRLSEYASEQQNPSNAKHVARIDVSVPAPRLLREGVTFVDTPGLGSLATAGAAETVAYLPRCDLGIMLVDAGTALTHEDMAIVQALYQAGSAAQVLVSKADLLAPVDRERTVEYLRHHLQSEAGIAPPVHLVSVSATEADLCERWLQEQLQPLLDGHKQQAIAACRRKVDVLRETVIRALQARSGSPRPNAGDDAFGGQREEDLREAAAALEAARNEDHELSSSIGALTPKILVAAARSIGEGWCQESPADPDLSALLYRAMADAVAFVTAQARQRLDAMRTDVIEAIRPAANDIDGPDEIPVSGPLPVVHPPAALQQLELRQPFWLPLLGSSWSQGWIVQQMQRQIGTDLQDALRRHGEQVRVWFLHAMDELKAAFSRQADLLRAGSMPVPRVGGDAASPTGEAAITRDLAILQRWKGEGTP